MFVDKETREVKIVDIAIPGDTQVKQKELGKMEKYQLLKDKIKRLIWNTLMRKVCVVPVWTNWK